MRYRDGRLVSTRGEKYIVESLNADYDGGSRGRVKTKGTITITLLSIQPVEAE